MNKSTGEKHTILLVDDSQNDRFLLRAAFEKAKSSCQLYEVHNGEEAVAYLKGEATYSDRVKYPLPTLMLLDLNMPMIDGFGVLAWVRAQEFLKRLTIVVMTASTRTEDLERAFDLGANSFIIKPARFDELIDTIRSLDSWLHHCHLPSLTK